MACSCGATMKNLGKNSVSGSICPQNLSHKECCQKKDHSKCYHSINDDQEEPLLTQKYLSEFSEDPEPQKNIPINNAELKYLYFTFFLAGIGLSMCWGSISFLVTYWTTTYGNKIWPMFLVAYNVPGFFVLVLQLSTDQWCQVVFFKNSTRRAYLVRGVFALGLLALCCIGTPFLEESHKKAVLMVLILTVGIAVGSAHGWLFSLGSLFPTKCTAYLLGGTGMATLILLILTLVLVPNQEPTETHFFIYFGASGVIIILSIIGYILMMMLSATKTILNNDQEIEMESSQHLSFSHEIGILETFKSIWIEAFTVFQVTFTVVTLSSLVTMVPPSHFSATTYPVILLYVTSIAYYVGNELGVWIPIQKKVLFFAGLIRFFLLIPVLFYMSQTHWLNDFVFIVAMAFYAAFGSYFTSKGYQLSAQSVSKSKSLTIRVSNIINMCLYCGVFVGLTTPFWLRKSFFSFL